VIHYHGGPITPESCAARAWTRRHAFVSYAAPLQIALAASVSQSFSLDNGAFSVWKTGQTPDWPGYYQWCDRWLAHPNCDWAVIPDVIGGTEAQNDALLAEWPHGDRGVPVWHLNESADRLRRLAEAFPRIALGSAAEWDIRKPRMCIGRLYDTLPAICNGDGFPLVKLHGLRMLNVKITTKIPLASADSTNVARNIRYDTAWTGSYAPATKETRVDVLIERIELHPTPSRLLTAEERLAA
jgi:hypothetical protein